MRAETERSYQYLYLPQPGLPADVEFDCVTGCVTALIVPGPGRFFCFLGRENEYVIPWKCICQIGEDIILVEIQEDKFLRRERLL